MTDFKARLIDERLDLREKILNLEAFLKSSDFSTISDLQQELLPIQYDSMCVYYQCLSSRLFELGASPDQEIPMDCPEIWLR